MLTHTKSSHRECHVVGIILCMCVVGWHKFSVTKVKGESESHCSTESTSGVESDKIQYLIN